MAKKKRDYAKKTEKGVDPMPEASLSGEVPDTAPVSEVKSTVVYEVAPNRSITSLRGILGPGMGVKPEYFADGAKSIVALNNMGALVKRKK